MWYRSCRWYMSRKLELVGEALFRILPGRKAADAPCESKLGRWPNHGRQAWAVPANATQSTCPLLIPHSTPDGTRWTIFSWRKGRRPEASDNLEEATCYCCGRRRHFDVVALLRSCHHRTFRPDASAEYEQIAQAGTGYCFRPPVAHTMCGVYTGWVKLMLDGFNRDNHLLCTTPP
jgi:hypothetical protein